MKDLKVDSTNIIFPLKLYSNGSEKIKVLSGSKMLVSLFVKSLSGTKVVLSIKNSFSPEFAMEEIEKIELSIADRKDITILDFHDYFQFDLEVIGGSAEVIVATTLRNNSNEDFSSNSQIIKELNRLVPEFYDDAEVMSETAGKQPILIEFRKSGLIIRTIQIDYINEVFKRVRVV